MVDRHHDGHVNEVVIKPAGGRVVIAITHDDHASFLRQLVRLALIAAETGGNEVGLLLRVSTPRDRNDVVDGQLVSGPTVPTRVLVSFEYL